MPLVNCPKAMNDAASFLSPSLDLLVQGVESLNGFVGESERHDRA